MANAEGKGRGGKNNFTNTRRYVAKTDEDRSDLQKVLTEGLEAYRMPKVRSDDELMSRLDEYFEKCRVRDSVPTLEEMYLYTGYTFDGMKSIETGHNKGFSPETAPILKKAKDYLKMIDGKLATMGKINFLAYCFRAKNYYGMVDKVEHVITPTQPYEQIDTKTIKERYQLNMSDIIDSDTKKD